MLLAGPAHAEPFTQSQALDERMISDVTAAALAFMAPRTLEPVATAQLTLWGLRGLTTLDPRLTTELTPQALRLNLDGRTILQHPPPPEADIRAWADATAQISRAAWDASEPVRRLGTTGVLRAFFDEMLNHLDPYSRYASPAEAHSDSLRRNGSAGIGVELTRTGSFFLVRGIVEGSPAAQAEVRPGEMLLAIDGQSLAGADMSAALALMAGPEATPVTLTLRVPQRAPRSITLIRTLITPPTVFAQRQGDLLIIRIAGFARDTAEALAREITRPQPPGHPALGLVIDLRGNRGGLLRQAVASVETLVTHGLIATTAGRDPQARRVYEADGADLAHGLPVVVLVDGHSASAAEVMAAALADQRRAVVVGSATLGKGLVQTILPLPDGGALSLTWSRILAPLGWPLQALGVLPEVCTSLGEDQLHRQLSELSAGRQPMARALTHHREARAPIPPATILDIRNACPADEGRGLDLFAAEALIHTPLAYASALIPVPASP
jgi:carboxyl-terminal processing protease